MTTLPSPHRSASLHAPVRPATASHESGDGPMSDLLATATSTQKRFDRNAVVVQKGDPSVSLYVIVSGRVKMTSLSQEGKEVTFAYIGPGELFGETAVLDGTTHTMNVTTLEPTIVRIVSRLDFHDAVRRNPQAALALATILSARLRLTSELAEDVAFLPVAARLAKRLLQLADQYGTATANGVTIGLRLCQHDLASLVSSTRESINKHLRLWEAEGLLKAKPGTVTILRPTQLRAMVRGCSACAGRF